VTNAEQNEAAMRSMYARIEAHEDAAGMELFSDDIQFNVIRSLPVNRIQGKQDAGKYIAQTLGWTPLDGDMKLEHLAASGDVVFSIHVEAAGTPREHRHVMVWRFDNGKIVEINELTLGDPPSLQGVDIEALEKLGHKVVVLANGSAGG